MFVLLQYSGILLRGCSAGKGDELPPPTPALGTKAAKPYQQSGGAKEPPNLCPK